MSLEARHSLTESPQIAEARHAWEWQHEQIQELRARIDAVRETIARLEAFAVSGSIEHGKDLPTQEKSLTQLRGILQEQEQLLARLEDVLATLSVEDEMPHTTH